MMSPVFILAYVQSPVLFIPIIIPFLSARSLRFLLVHVCCRTSMMVFAIHVCLVIWCWFELRVIGVIRVRGSIRVVTSVLVLLVLFALSCLFQYFHSSISSTRSNPWKAQRIQSCWFGTQRLVIIIDGNVVNLNDVQIGLGRKVYYLLGMLTSTKLLSSVTNYDT